MLYTHRNDIASEQAIHLDLSLPRSRFWMSRNAPPLWGSVAWHPKNGCEGDYLDLTPVSQKMDSARFIQRITQLVSQLLIHWIVVYPVDSAIQRVNNRGLALQTLVSVNHWINHYPGDSVRGNHLCLPLDRDFSSGSVVLFAIPFFTCK